MATQKFTPRRYNRSDLDKIEQLFRTHFEDNHVAKRRLIFDWIARYNPIAGNETTYLVINDDHNIIAYEGRMPVDLAVNGEKEKGYFFHDTLVHPEYRKKGLGLAFVSSLKRAWEDETDTFAVGIWMNEFTHEIMKRRRYYQLNAPNFIRPVNLEPILTRIIRNKLIAQVIASFGHGLISLYDFLTRHHFSDISISQIERFDQRFDTFAEKISRKFPLIVLRHSKYLNWKYIDKPLANYIVFTAERNGDLTGYVVLLLSENERGDMKMGVIVDILTDPDDSRTIASLCQAAIKYFRKEGVDIIQCVLTNKNFIKILKKYLFFKRQKPALPVMIANLHKHPERELITDIDNWFLTLGDSDAVVWT